MATVDSAPPQEPTEIVIDEATAAAIQEVQLMLERPIPAAEGHGATLLESLLTSISNGLLTVQTDASKGRRVIAARNIQAGEHILEEEAVAYYLARSPGTDAVFVMTVADDASIAGSRPVVTALPQWPSLRTLRDTLTLADRFVGKAEELYGLLAQLSAYHTKEHIDAGWAEIPILPPGIPSSTESGGSNCVPPRAQLLYGIAQCNAFTATLPPQPDEDYEDSHAGDVSAWRSSLLWPLIARIQCPEDRERLFDDDEPLGYIPAYFPAAALFNHSCQPNVTYSGCKWEMGDACPVLRMTALADIAAGDEVCISYGYSTGGDDERPVDERRYKLLLTYRFRCACALCREEEPAAGTPEDPLMAHFVNGVGLDGQKFFYEVLGGGYPATMSCSAHVETEEDA